MFISANNAMFTKEPTKTILNQTGGIILSKHKKAKDNATIKIKGGLEIKGGTLTIKDGGSLEIG